MTICIYSGVTLTPAQPLTDTSRSDEHIIPLALGGSNQFVTDDVCRKANNDLGSEVDAAFMNVLPLAIKRHQFKLTGHGGSIAPIIWEGTASNGSRARMRIEAEQGYTFELLPNVERNEHGEVVRIGGDRAHVERILSGLMKKWQSTGVIGKTDDLLGRVEAAIATAEVAAVDGATFQVNYFDRDAWLRGLLKIGLAAGHKLMGERWSRGEAAKIMRQVVNNPRGQWPTRLLRGYDVGTWDRRIRMVFGANKDTLSNSVHIIAVSVPTNRQNAWMGISLFGGNGVPQAFFDVGPDAGILTPRFDSLPKSSIIGYRINPQTRTCEPWTLADSDIRVAREG